MPEIPDLEGYKAYFNRRAPGQVVEAVELPIPWIVRAPREELLSVLEGNELGPVERRGKYLLFSFKTGHFLMVHAMLTGRFDYCEAAKRRHSRTAFILRLDSGMEVRYFDERRMGKAYLARAEEFAEKAPRWSEMGPDVMAPDLSEDKFIARLKQFRGQIKNVITNERCVAGIGNAYSDEVLWEARIQPFRTRTELSDQKLGVLYNAIGSVMQWSIALISERMEREGLPVHHYRDHLRVHRRGGKPCPRCGATISEVSAGERVTSFCRNCQE